MVGDLTKATWTDLLEALAKVPAADRNGAWDKVREMVQEILKNPNSLSVPVVPCELRYAPECDLCHKAIMLDEDYVFKAITCKFHHYDCFYRGEWEPKA